MLEQGVPGESALQEAVSSLLLDQGGGGPTGGAAPLLELAPSGAEACGGDVVAAGLEQVLPVAPAMGGVECGVAEGEGVAEVASCAVDFLSALFE